MGLLEELKQAYLKMGLEVDGTSLGEEDVSLFIQAKIHPAAKKEDVVIRDDVLNVFVKDRPVDGQANQRLRKVLSKTLGINQSSVLIDKGHRSKIKKIVINYQTTPSKSASFFKEKIESLCIK